MKNFVTILVLVLQPISYAANSKNPLEHFKNTYDECDRSFTEIYIQLKAQVPNSETFEFTYPEGTIKSYYFPAGQKPESLLIMISGTHGIEAFAGSAVQRYLLTQNLDLKKTAILMIHGFNLYGFKNYRRVNENNIDLNRNFVIDRAGFKADDSKYGTLNSFLNPETPPELGFFSRSGFLIDSVLHILKYSMENLRSSILRGQYSYPKGIFYGGDQTQAQLRLIENLVEKYIKNYKKVFLIDLHTGYGERSKLHLLAGKTKDENSVELLKVFSEDELDFSDKKKFYAVEGELLTYFARSIQQRIKGDVTAVTFEYGTLDSQKTLGSVESLRRVILENQNFYHPSNQETATEIKSLYREMFYPSDEQWRMSILQQTDEKMKKVLRHLEN